MYAKINITGIIEVVTGMHIGASSAFSPIGSVDSPVIRDTLSNLPMIPGSSLKGKMRTLLAKQYNGQPVKSPDLDDEKIRRLFGGANPIRRGRLLFSDVVMSNKDELYGRGAAGLTEIKFENTIGRFSATANPRQIERVIRGAEFPLDIIYEVNDQQEDEIAEDFRIIRDGLMLLQYDYIGGSGSRGYGKVKFKDIAAEVVVGQLDGGLLEKCMTVMDGFK